MDGIHNIVGLEWRWVALAGLLDWPWLALFGLGWLCSKSRNQIFIIQLFFSNFFDFFLTFSDNFWQYFDFFGPFWPVLVPGTHPDRPGRPGNFDFRAAGLKRTIPGRFRATFCLFWPLWGSTAHPLGMQVRVLNHWAAARRSWRSRRAAGCSLGRWSPEIRLGR